MYRDVKVCVFQVDTDHPKSLLQGLANGLEGLHFELLLVVYRLVEWLEIQYGARAPILFWHREIRAVEPNALLA